MSWHVYLNGNVIGTVVAETWMMAREVARGQWPFPRRMRRKLQVRAAKEA